MRAFATASTPVFIRTRNLGFAALLALLAARPAPAASIPKADNADDLNLGSSWVGGVAPTGADIALWDATVATNFVNALGGNVSWLGISITNPASLVTITPGNTLTLGAGGIDMATAAQDFTISSDVALGANQAWTVAAGRFLTVSGGVSGSGTVITKAGNGFLTLSGINTFSGGINLDGGTTTIFDLGNLGSGPISFNGGTLQFLAPGIDISSRTVIINAGGATLELVGGDITFANGIGNGGAGGLTKTGVGILTLQGSSTYLGATNIAAGAMRFDTPGSIGGTGRSVTVAAGAEVIAGYAMDNAFLNRLAENTNAFVVALGANSNNNLDFSSATGAALPNASLGVRGIVTYGGTLTPNGGEYRLGGGSGTLTLNGVNALTGANNVTVSGQSEIVLGAANNFSGNTTLNEGTLRLGAAGALPSTTHLTVNSLASLNMDGFNVSIESLSGAGAILLGTGNMTIAGSVSTTFSGALFGDGALLKTGASVLTLSGFSTYSGGTVLAGGTIVFSDASNFGVGNFLFNGGTLQYAANNISDLSAGRVVTFGSGGATVNTNGNNVFWFGDVGGGGTGAFTKTGAGLLELAGTNNYSGDTNVTGGTLAFGPASLGSGAISVNGATLQWGFGNTLDISSRVVTIGSAGATFNTNGNDILFANGIGNGGTGGFTKAGAGTLVMTAANTYTGNTTVSGGTLVVSTLAALPGTARNVTVAANATLGATFALDNAFLQRLAQNNNASVIALGADSANNLDFGSAAGAALPNASLGAIGAVTYTGVLTPSGVNYRLGGGGGTLTMANANAITGATSNLFISGPGTVVLAQANDFGGNTTINSGNLTLGHANAIGNSAAVTIAGTGLLDLNGQTATLRSIAGAGSISLGAGSLNVSGNGTNTTFSGSISGAGGFTKSGNGILTLSGFNSYAGNTSIQGGTLVFSNLNNLGLGTGLELNGGTLRYGANTTVDISTLTVTIGSANGTIDTNGNNLSFANPIGNSGAGAFIKAGNGQLTLSAANTYTGGTVVTGGTLFYATADALIGTGRNVSGGNGTTIVNGFSPMTNAFLNRLEENGNFFTVAMVGNTAANLDFSSSTGANLPGASLGAVGDVAFNGTIVPNADVYRVGGGGGTLRILLNNVLGGGGRSVVVSGPGTVVLSPVNNFSGSLTIQGGGLVQFPTSASIGSGNTVLFNGGGLQWGVGNNYDITQRAVTIGPGGAIFDTRSNEIVFANSMGGSTGGITKLGPGTLTLNAPNTFGGSTQVLGGVLLLGHGQAIQNSVLVNNSSDGLVLFGNFSAASVGGLSGSQSLPLTNVLAQPIALTLNVAGGTSVTYGGVVGSTGIASSIVKNGDGAQTLSAANLYTGGTIVNAGTLTLGTATSAGTGPIVLNGGTLGMGAFPYTNPISVLGNSSINAVGVTTISGPMTGNGTLNITNTAVFTVDTSMANFNGTIVLANQAFRFNSGAANNNLGNANATFNLGTGTGSLTSRNTGAIISLGAVAGGSNTTLTGSGNGTVVWQIGGLNTDSLFEGNINDGTGATGITKVGTGTLTLTGGGNYTGTVTIANGTLRIGNGGAGGAIGATVVNNGVLLFNRDGVLTVPGTISGNGNLRQDGPGTVVFSSDNTYTGITTVAGGTLAVANLGNGGAPSGVGNTSAAAANLVINGGALRYTGVGGSTDRGLTLGTAGGSLEASGAGAFTFGNATGLVLAGTNTARTLTLGGTSTAANALAATIGDNGTGATSVVKNGAGVWSLTAANTYTGGTIINSGVLRANNASGSATGTGAVVINNGGTLGGNGTVSGTVLVSTGGHVAPGASVGTLTLNNLDASAGGGILDFEFASTSLYDQLFVNTSDGLLLNAPGFNFYAEGTENPWSTTGTYNLIRYSGTNITTTGFTVLNGLSSLSYDFITGMVNTDKFLQVVITVAPIPNNWDILTGGNWSVSSNWFNAQPAGVPNAPGVIANFPAKIIAPSTVAVDGNFTVGGLDFSSPESFTLSNAGGSLTLNNNGTAANLTASVGNHTINAPLTLSGLGFSANISSGASLSIGGAISGSGADGVIKNGNGLLVLTGANTFGGGSLLNAGTLSFAAGGIGTGAVTFNGGALRWEPGNTADISAQGLIFTAAGQLDTNGNNITLASPIGGGGVGALVKSGNGVLKLTATNTYTGGTQVTGGSVEFTTLANIPGNITLNGGGLRWASGSTVDASTAGIFIGANDGTLDTNGNNVTLTRSVGGTTASGFTKTGNGVLTLTPQTTTIAGQTSIANATVVIANTTNITVGQIVTATNGVPANTTVIAVNPGNIVLSANATSNNAGNTLTFSGSGFSGPTTLAGGVLLIGADNALGRVPNPAAPGQLVFNGGALQNSAALTLAPTRGIAVGPNGGGLITAFDMTYAGAIANGIGGSGELIKSGPGILNLTAASSWNGGIRVNEGTLNVANVAGAGTGVITLNGGNITQTGNTSIGNTLNIIGAGGAYTNSATSTWGGNFTGDSTLLWNATNLLSVTGGEGQFGNFTGTIEWVANGQIRIQNINNKDWGNATIDFAGTTGSILSRDGGNQSIGALIGGTGANLLGTSTADVAGASSVNWIIGNKNLSTTYSGGITDALFRTLVTKVGTGALVLDGNTTYTGNLTILGGTVQIGSGGAAGSLGAANSASVVNEGTLIFNRSGTPVAITGLITGSGNLLMHGTGTETLARLNTYTGLTSIRGGTVVVTSLANGGSPSGLGASSSAASNLILNGATLRYNGTANTSTDRLFTLAGNATIDAAGSGTVNFTNSGAVVLGGGTAKVVTLAGSNAGTNVFAPSLGNDGAGVTSLVKAGTTTWVLNANNTYTGNTTVSAGRLFLNGTGATANVAVASGATFGGSATLAGANLTVASGATLSPGSSVGNLTVATLALAANTTLNFEFNTTANDRLIVNGAGGLSLTGDNSSIAVNLFAENSSQAWTVAGNYTLFQYSGALTGNVNQLFVNAPLSSLTYNFVNTGSSLNLVITTQLQTNAWNVTTGGNWGDAGNWNGGVPTAGQVAKFPGVITAPATVAINGDFSAGGLDFISSIPYTIGPGGGNLTLDNSGSAASILVEVGDATISAPLRLTTFGASANVTANSTLTISGGIGQLVSGASLVKLGNGVMELSGANTYDGGTVLNAGTVQFTASNNLGAGAVTLSGGTLRWAPGSMADVSDHAINFGASGGTFDTNGNDVTFANGIGNNSIGGFTKAGLGTLTLQGTGAYSGITSITGGAIQFTAASNFGTGGIVVNGGALRWASGSTADVSSAAVRVGSAGGTLDTNGNNVALGSGVGGTGSFTKSGNGVLTMAAPTGQVQSITFTENSTSITVNSTAGLFVGQGVTGTNLTAGAVITDITGNVVTLSQPTLTASTNIAFTFANLTATSDFGSGSNQVTLSGGNAGVVRVGQLVTGTGIPAGTFVLGLAGNTVTLSNNTTAPGTAANLTFNANGFNGSTSVTGGTLAIASDLGLGVAPTAVTPGFLKLDGGTLQALSTFTLAANRGIVLGAEVGPGSGVIDVVAGATMTYGGIIANNGLESVGQLIKNGNGNLNVTSNASTFTGGTVINSGTVTMGAVNSLGSGAVTLNGGTLFWVSNYVNPITVLSNSTINNNANVQFGSAISGNATLSVVGGAMNLTTRADFTNFHGVFSVDANKTVRTFALVNPLITGHNMTLNLTVAGANLILRDGGIVNLGGLNGIAGTIVGGYNNAVDQLAAQGGNQARYFIGYRNEDNNYAGTLVNGSVTANVTGTTSYPTNLEKVGSAILTLTNNASGWVGSTTLTGGTLAVTSITNYATALATNTTVPSNGLSALGAPFATTPTTPVNAINTVGAATLVFNGGTLRYIGAGNTTNRLFTINPVGGTLEASGTGALVWTSTGSIALSGNNTARTFTLSGNSAANNTLAAALGDNGTGATSLVKDGVGHWVLSGNSSYTGVTTVLTGTLTNNGTLSGSSITVNGGRFNNLGTVANNAAINNGGTLSGTGTISGLVSANTGSTIAPGADGVGNMTLGGLTTATGSTLNFEFDGSANDLIVTTLLNGLVLNGGGLNLFVAGGSQPLQTPGFYNLLQFNGTLGGNLSNLAFLNTPAGYNYVLSTTGSGAEQFVRVQVTFTGAPNSWAVDASGNWSVASNWSSGVINAAGTIANFPPVITEPRNVVVDGTFTAGGLAFVSQSPLNYTVANGGGQLILDNLALPANISATGNSNSTIAVPLQLTANGANVDVASGALVSITGNISQTGSGALTKTGIGQLNLSGSNSFAGGVVLEAGTLGLGSAGALGISSLTINGGTLDATVAGLTLNNNPQQWNGNFTFAGSQDLNIGTGTVILGNNITLNVLNGTLTVGGAIGGSNQSLTKGGNGNLVLAGSNSHDGGTTVTQGNLTLGSDNVFADVGTLTVAGGTLNLNGHSDTVAALILSGGNVSGSGTLSSTGGFDVRSGTIAANLSGASGLAKTTNGTVTVTTPVSYAGLTAVENGSLVLAGGDNRLPAGSLVVLGNSTTSNGILVLGNATGASNQTLSSLSVSSGGNVAANFVRGGNANTTSVLTLNIADNITSTFNGVIGQGGGNNTFTTENNIGLNKTGAGVLELLGENTYTGGTNIGAGVLRTSAAAGLGSVSSPVIINDATLNIGGTFTTDRIHVVNNPNSTISVDDTFALTVGTGGVIGLGNLNKSGPGTLVLAGSSGSYTYLGATNINTGTLQLGIANAIPNISDVTVAVGATLDMNNLADTVGSLAGGGTVNLGSVGGALSVGANDKNTAFSGTITGSGTFTKVGEGITSLSGSNPFIGTVNINGGTLRVNSVDGVGTNPVTVNSGGALGGNGTVVSVTVNAGGRVAPGTSLGTLTVTTDFVWNSDNVTGLQFELSNSSSASDLLSIGGNLTKGAGVVFLFDFQGTGYFGGTDTTYTLMDFTQNSGYTQSDFGFSNLGNTAGWEGHFVLNANNLQFVITGIPEPSEWALIIGLTGLGLAAWRRRRSRRA